MAGTNVWLVTLNDEPLHHWLVVVSSIATIAVAVMVVEAADEAAPVIVPVQSDP
jgi:hypothetical protein